MPFQTDRTSKISSILAVCLVAASVSVPAFAAPTAAFNAALVEAQKKLGTLEPWQKKIFDEEIMPDSSRFIRDYRGNEVEVDVEGLRSYLSFYAPKALGKAEIKALVHLKSDQDCAKCAAALPAVKRRLQSYLVRRGITPVWVTGDELLTKDEITAPDPSTEAPVSKAGEALVELKLAELVRKKGVNGAWSAELKQVADAEHPGEDHYQVSLHMRMNSSGAAKDLKADKTLEVLKNDSMETAVSRMMVDTLSELGTQSNTIAQVASDELEVSIKGLTSFNQMKGFKEALQELVAKKLNAAVPVELRRLSQESIVFALHTKESPEELKKAVVLVNFESHGLIVREVTRSEDGLNVIVAEVQ
ncbi:MAG: hypothetical protein H7222_11465 [Methylotenera sp.]|nr:hypothetical protein [Oligoflexia bacterium]